MEKEIRCRVTPNYIEDLKKNEIFVFGSNLQGAHGGGAAYAAFRKFGAIWGQGVGLQGQSYAIPTMQGGVDTIKPYTDEFIAFAKEHTEYHFLVTKIGCGIAGFNEKDIAPLFTDAVGLPNVSLPKKFLAIILKILGIIPITPVYSFLQKAPKFKLEKTDNPYVYNIEFEEAPSEPFYESIHDSIAEMKWMIEEADKENKTVSFICWWHIDKSTYEFTGYDDFLGKEYWEACECCLNTYTFTIEKGSKTATYQLNNDGLNINDLNDLDEW